MTSDGPLTSGAGGDCLGDVGVSGGSSGREPLAIWVLGRQHPGEPQGSWFVEGLLKTLAAATEAAAAAGGGREGQNKKGSAVQGAAAGAAAAGGGGGLEELCDSEEWKEAVHMAADLLQEAVVYVVPNMCPDGVAR